MKINLNTISNNFPSAGAHLVKFKAVTTALKTVILDAEAIQSLPGLSKTINTIKKDKDVKHILELSTKDQEHYGPMLAKHLAKKYSTEPDKMVSEFLRLVTSYKVLNNGRIKVTDAFETLEFEILDETVPLQILHVTNQAILLGILEEVFPEWYQMEINERTAMYPNGYPINELTELVGKEMILYYYIKPNKNDATRPYRQWWVRTQ